MEGCECLHFLHLASRHTYTYTWQAECALFIIVGQVTPALSLSFSLSSSWTVEWRRKVNNMHESTIAPSQRVLLQFASNCIQSLSLSLSPSLSLSLLVLFLLPFVTLFSCLHRHRCHSSLLSVRNISFTLINYLSPCVPSTDIAIQSKGFSRAKAIAFAWQFFPCDWTLPCQPPSWYFWRTESSRESFQGEQFTPQVE